jgi:hypothetical protein
MSVGCGVKEPDEDNGALPCLSMSPQAFTRQLHEMMGVGGSNWWKDGRAPFMMRQRGQTREVHILVS